MDRQKQEWTKEEIRALRALFKNNSNSHVATVLERSAKSVERKAARLGLRKTKKYLRLLGRRS